MIVNSIEEYIIEVKKIVMKKKTPKQLIVYRGEKQDYLDSSFVPNIFRDQNYKKNKNYEANLYHELYSSGIVGKQSLLQTAIDAQHGGFPSRLLDVTYNSLVALYFATETEPENNSNPRVAVFFIDEIYTPGSHKSEELFNSIIDAESYYRKIKICAKNHKLIDHMNKNERIKAQQGAFILFQGEEFEKIPNYMYQIIEINKSESKKMQEELSSLFGLTVGKIYPEPSYQIDYIKNKMELVNSKDHSLENEFKLAIDNFQKIILSEIISFSKFIDEKINIYSQHSENQILTKIDHIESKILIFQQDILESINQSRKIIKDKIEEKKIEINVSNKYNKMIYLVYEKLQVAVTTLNNKSEFHLKMINLSTINEFLITTEFLETSEET